MKDLRFKLSSIVALSLVGVMLPLLGQAQESRVAVPWENIVSAEDTFVFWVLASFAVLLLVLIWIVAGVTKGLVSDKQLWEAGKGRTANALVMLITASALTLLPSFGFAQAEETATEAFQMSDGLFWIMVFVDAFLVLVLFGMLYNLNGLIRSLRAASEEEEVEAEESVLEGFWQGSLSEAVPVEEEGDILLDHEYDGIRELDNKLPPWWLYMFYFTIFFGVVYIIHFEITPIPGLGGVTLLGQVEEGTQTEMYEREMAKAEKEKAEFLASSANNVDETNVTYLTDATSLANGKETYMSLCVACHGPSGGSSPNGVGPNLTDEYWIHGGGIKNIFETVKYGVPTKGMISWESQLTPVKMQEVSSYILSLQGTDPPNAKEPQGEIWVEEQAAPEEGAEEQTEDGKEKEVAGSE